MLSTERIVLASASPRRFQLLRSLGIAFTVEPSAIDEALDPSLSPEDQAIRLSQAKAQEVRSRSTSRATVLGADTLVVLQNRILAKPADVEAAVETLRVLRGREHRVVTGASVAGAASGYRETTVLMRPYSDAEIQAYVATGDPMDKAGAYAIQHPAFRPVEKIEGCYCNVVGLPLGLVRDLLDLAVTRPPQCKDCPDWTSAT